MKSEDRVIKPKLGTIKKMKTYTGDEIVALFEKGDLPNEMRGEILNRLSGFETAMVDIIEGKKITVSDPHGDWWVEGYNACATIFQRYNT